MAVAAFVHARSAGTYPSAKLFKVGLGRGNQNCATHSALSVQGALGPAQHLNGFQVEDLGVRAKGQVDDVVRHAIDIKANGAVIGGAGGTGTPGIIAAIGRAAGRQRYAGNQLHDLVQILHARTLQLLA